MWLCASWNPGSSVAPRRSATSRARTPSGPAEPALTARMRPLATATDRARGRAVVLPGPGAFGPVEDRPGQLAEALLDDALGVGAGQVSGGLPVSRYLE